MSLDSDDPLELEPVAPRPYDASYIRPEDARFLMAMMVQIADLVRDVVPESETTGRIKSEQATWDKVRRRGVYVRKIHDKIAVRVIVPDAQACFDVVERLHGAMPQVPDAFDDYISSPKDNGYQALHTTVLDERGRPLEVQVRSREMHQRAEYGSADHRTYKSRQSTAFAFDANGRPGRLPGSVAFVSTYPPEDCVVGAYTGTLTQAVQELRPDLRCRVVALASSSHSYPEQVCYQIERERLESYREAARFLNGSDVTILSVQHEPSIYEGTFGGHVLELMREVRMPIVTTLHAVTARLSSEERAIMDEVCALSEGLVVFNHRTVQLIGRLHGAPQDKVSVISRRELAPERTVSATGQLFEDWSRVALSYVDCFKRAYENYPRGARLERVLARTDLDGSE